MVRDVAFGQYFPGDSIIHKLDPRGKIIVFIAFIFPFILVIINVFLAITVAFTALFLILSKIPAKFYFKSLKVIIAIVIFTSLLNLFYGSGEALWQWWIFKLTVAGIHRAVFVTVRIVALILASSCLTFTTSPT